MTKQHPQPTKLSIEQNPKIILRFNSKQAFAEQNPPFEQAQDLETEFMTKLNF